MLSKIFFRKPKFDSGLKVVVGLGNPGLKYRLTRHNIGFLVLDDLAKEYAGEFKKCSFFKAFKAQIRVNDQKILLVKPETFMNHSGLTVRSVFKKLNGAVDQMLVVVDDFQIPFGQLRLKLKGSHGGHNGLRSIQNHLQTSEYSRLRVGLGDPLNKDLITEFVLGKFTSAEQKKLPQIIHSSSDCIKLWAERGIEQAMEQFNRRI